MPHDHAVEPPETTFDKGDWSWFDGPELTTEHAQEFIADMQQLATEDPLAAREKMAAFYDTYLGHSNATESIAPFDEIELLSRSRQTKELGQLSKAFVGDLANIYGFAEGKMFTELASKIKSVESEKAAIYLKICGDIVDECAAITSSMSETSAHGMVAVSKEILNDPEQPAFTHMVAKALQSWVDTARFNPQRTFVTTMNNELDAKVSFGRDTATAQRATELSHKIDTPELGRSWSLGRISPDEIALLDHTGTPQAIAALSEQQETEAAMVALSAHDISELQQL